MPPDSGTLFLTKEGEALSPNQLTDLARSYITKADIGKTGACHLFRHTCATLMLEGGADVRYIQEMLGHVRLETTQIYTQVSIRRLKAIHAMTHPSAKLDRLPKTEAADGAGKEPERGAPPVIEPLHVRAGEAVADSAPSAERERAASTAATKKPLARCDAGGECREEAASELLLSLALEAEEEDEDLEKRKEEDEGREGEREGDR